MSVSFKQFSVKGHAPTKATPKSACYDVHSSIDVTIRPGETKTVPLDIGFKFAKKYVCLIYPRSSMSLSPTFLGGGIIDSDYRGKFS